MTIDADLTAAVDTVEALIAVLDQEKVAVSAHDRAAALSLQARKAALTETYMAQVQRISRQPDAVAAAGAEALGRLSEARERLAEALASNMRALDISRQAARRVFDVIAESARRAAGAVDGYDRGGRTAALGARPLAVSVNGRF